MTRFPASASTTPNRTGKTQVVLLPAVGRRLLRVARVEDVTARYRRIVFTGDELGHDFPFRRFAPTDHVKLFFPHPGTGELVFPLLTENGWVVPEGAGAPIFRDYTVRAHDAHAGELTIDFVVHGHGVAGVWARGARPGDELGQLGPRGNIVFPEDHTRFVAAGDETALPAISRILEEAPSGSRVTAIIEIADVREEQSLAVAAGVEAEILWIPRDNARVDDGHSSALETAVRGRGIGAEQRTFVFAAGEATAMKPIRRYLRRELGLPKEHVDVDGYWKRGIANLDHHSADLDDDET